MKGSQLLAAGAAVIAAYPRLLFAERNSAALDQPESIPRRRTLRHQHARLIALRPIRARPNVIPSKIEGPPQSCTSVAVPTTVRFAKATNGK